MKLIFAIFFAFVMTMAAFAQGNYVDATGSVQTLETEHVKGGVINSAAGALTKGMAVCLDRTADDGISVEYCAAEGDKALCVIAETSCAVGARCKCIRRGFINYGDFDYAATATAAGGVVYAGTDGDIVAIGTPDAGDFPVGVAVDAVSADTTALEVYVDL